MRRAALLGLALAALTVAGVALAQSGSVEEGRIGPEKSLVSSGRQLQPYGKLTALGNYPAGGALTPNGRFLWTLSAGRGPNDIRIVEVNPEAGCKQGKPGRKCRIKRRERVGRVVQVIPRPHPVAVRARSRLRATATGAERVGARRARVAGESAGRAGGGGGGWGGG